MNGVDLRLTNIDLLDEKKNSSSTDVDHLRNTASYMRGPNLGGGQIQRRSSKNNLYFQVLHYSLVLLYHTT